jgi:amino acid transporter
MKKTYIVLLAICLTIFFLGIYVLMNDTNIHTDSLIFFLCYILLIVGIIIYQMIIDSLNSNQKRKKSNRIYNIYENRTN